MGRQEFLKSILTQAREKALGNVAYSFTPLDFLPAPMTTFGPWKELTEDLDTAAKRGLLLHLGNKMVSHGKATFQTSYYSFTNPDNAELLKFLGIEPSVQHEDVNKVAQRIEFAIAQQGQDLREGARITERRSKVSFWIAVSAGSITIMTGLLRGGMWMSQHQIWPF